MSPLRPMLGDLELQQVQRIETEEDQILVQHRVPGLEGDFLQALGRRGSRLALTGVLSGAGSQEGLKKLREKFKAAEPISFVSDIATATKVDQVLIEEMEVRDLAGKPERFEYTFVLREFTPPPAEESEEPPPAPVTPEPPDDKIDRQVGTLIVEVTVEGDPGFDFNRVTVTVEGKQAKDDSILSRTLTNRSGNVWTETDFPAGSYTVTAVASGDPEMTGSAPATVQPGETARAQIVLRPGAVIAKAFVVHFRFDNSFVEPCMRHVLRQAARHAKDNRSEKMLVVGHTDKTGSNQYNQSLSERRARSVFAYLTSGRDAAATAAARSEWNTLRRRATGALPSVLDTWGTHQYQYMLQDLGFYSGNVDGDHGPLTDEAVRTFRVAKGLPPGTTVDDATWEALIKAYMEQDQGFMDVPESQLLPNSSDGCDGGVLKWLGCGEEQPLPQPKPPTEKPHRQYRRVEILFVRASRLPCQVPKPDTFDLPTAGAVGPRWCLGPGNPSNHACFATRDCGAATPGQWCITPAEPETIPVRGSLKFEDGTPAANVEYVLIAPDGEYMDGEGEAGPRRGEGIFGRTNKDGTFEYPGKLKGVGIYTMEIHGPHIARAASAPPESAKGNVVCQRLDGSSGFDVILLLEAGRLLAVVQFEPDRSFIRPAGKRALKTLAGLLQRSPQGRRLLLAGHTDLVENPATADALSLRRARAVFAFLTGNPPDPDDPSRTVWRKIHDDEGWKIREIEIMLGDLGFRCAPNQFGPQAVIVSAFTSRGIRAFKGKHGLGDNDTVDDAFRNRLIQEYIAHNGASVPASRLLTPVGLLGCAARHPADVRGGVPFAGRSEKNRRVELLIFPRPPKKPPATANDCSQMPSWRTPLERRWLDLIGPKRPPVGGNLLDPADAEEILAVTEIANWDEAFTFDPPDADRVQKPTGNQPRADFIDRDPDRLFVQITDLDRKGAGTIRAKLRTVDLGAQVDPGAEHVLTESPNEPGVFRSNSILLVADEMDNGEINNGSAPGATPFKARNIANGALNDPLLRAELGGDLVVEYLGAELGSFSVCDPDCIKTIPVDIVILRKAGGTPVTTEDNVRERVRRMRQKYMQACLRFDVTIRTATVAEMPAGVVLDNVSGLRINPAATTRAALDPEERTLLESALNRRSAASPGGASSTILQIFYVNKIDGASAAGISYFKGAYTTPNPGNDIINAAIMAADFEHDKTLAHEVLHVLLNQFHNGSSKLRTNVFFESVVAGEELTFEQSIVAGPKRIPESQVVDVRFNPSDLIP